MGCSRVRAPRGSIASSSPAGADPPLEAAPGSLIGAGLSAMALVELLIGKRAPEEVADIDEASGDEEIGAFGGPPSH